MNFKLPKIYPITDSRLAELTHAAQVRQLIAGGAELIQLRDKRATPEDFYRSAAAAIKIARRENVKIIINDRVDLALALGADGVHLGQDDLPPECARAILGARAIIGFSTHNLAQAVAASKLPIDYLAIGPVFDTRTKENPDEIVGLEGVEKARAAIGDFPLVAIGGITAENFRTVLQAGANSAAVISDLLSVAGSISDRMRVFLRD